MLNWGYNFMVHTDIGCRGGQLHVHDSMHIALRLKAILSQSTNALA